MRKAFKAPKRRYARVFAPNLQSGMNSVTDSRVLPFSQSEAAYNVCVESGALENGYGVISTDALSRFHKVYYYKVYDEREQKMKGCYLAHNKDTGKIHGGAGGPNAWRELDGAQFAKAPLGVNYKLFGEDVFLLCGEEGMAVVDSSLRVITVPTAPSITSIAMHNERMFVTIGGRRNAVWFSDDLDPTNWNPELDEGGFIELEGEQGRLNKVVSFGGYVYVFREYGIARLTAYGEQREFSVANLFVSSGKIYGDTVAVCGDRIIFLAEDGLYSFDGLSSHRIARSLDGLIRADGGSTGCYSAGKYYLSARSRECAEDVNDILVALDPRTQFLSVNKGLNVISFSAVTEISGEKLWVHTPKMFMGLLEKGLNHFGKKPERLWRSGFGDLGYPDTRKLIAEIYLDTKYDCTVKITTEKGSKLLRFSGKNEAQRKRVNLIGTKVQMEIRAEGDISVARPALKFTNIA